MRIVSEPSCKFATICVCVCVVVHGPYSLALPALLCPCPTLFHFALPYILYFALPCFVLPCTAMPCLAQHYCLPTVDFGSYVNQTYATKQRKLNSIVVFVVAHHKTNTKTITTYRLAHYY